MQVRITRCKIGQKLPKRTRALAGIVFKELCPRVQIPPKHRDPVLRSRKGLHQRPIEILPVDQERETVRSFDAPAIVPWLENAGHKLYFSRLKAMTRKVPQSAAATISGASGRTSNNRRAAPGG